jgi:hypothetical protein
MPRNYWHLEPPPRTTRPEEWLPHIITAMEQRERVYMVATRATRVDLLRARATTAQDLARAKKRGYCRAAWEHQELLQRLDNVLKAFAPLMQEHPQMTFAEACTQMQMTGHPLRRVVEL